MSPLEGRLYRQLLLAVAVVTAVLLVPSWVLGDLIADDWLHIATMDGHLSEGVGGPTAYDLFQFMDGDPEHVDARKRSGEMVWFAHPELKIGFWRPLSSVLANVEHGIFGPAVLPRYLHSWLWYLLLCAGVAWIYLRTLQRSVAIGATLLFGIAATHYQPLVWAAARNTLISGAFGMAALVLHLRWREEGWRPGAILAPIGVALALSAGEVGLGALAFVVAYEAVGSTDPVRKRLLAILPGLTVAVVWLGVYVSLGYGTSGSGAYINPVDHPLEYLVALPSRLGAGIGVLFAGVPSALWALDVSARPWMSGVGAVVGVALLAVCGSVLGNRHLRWLGLGMGLALLPQLAGVLAPRSFVIPSVGATALIAATLWEGWTRWRRQSGAGAWLRIGACVGLVGIHVVLSPLTWLGWIAIYRAIMQQVADQRAALAEGVGDQPDADVVLVTSPTFFLARFTRYYWHVRGGPDVHSFVPLSMSPNDHVLHRTGEHTLELEWLDGEMFEETFEIIYRHPDHPFDVGWSYESDLMRAEVLSVGEQGPNRVSFRFSRPLDDPSLKLFAWDEGRIRELEVPGFGESVRLTWLPP